ncbi:phage holin family protein [Paenibacillus alvei]|uniref:Phage holin family protein n=1 Tax=Paenibacillus alvei TaxID=44250 RepID=A0ABT4H1V6_PAEAL|nr:phage holin family protein [Paenibacillus alvei]MCY9708223.1 phage holin family protein [Paenibacillus alvei]MCY9737931.1 phage holin family protein [Paenibacillus alvei]MCY9758463.1 phage holin family protein [Paenibacillus alvei]MCY9762639.1 phage holin family protein [Paenibacillus alvei]MCY9771043.1 phage holin family protein [Paenibacillus alvei]
MEKYWAFLTGAIITPAFNFLYGSGETSMAMLAALVFFLVMDWVTGIRAAKKDNTYASSYGIDGIFRSFFILLLPAGGNLLDKAFQLPGVLFGALCIGVLYHILQSMTANAIRAGWGNWFPEKILDWISNWVKSELEKKTERAASRMTGKGGDIDGN